MLSLKNITKNYLTSDTFVPALRGINLSFRQSEFVAILGPSGCGKTTLLNIIGGLDHYSSGDLTINSRSTKSYSDRDWDNYRNHSVGFVFQSYNLIPHQSVLSNVELALTLSGVSKSERRARAVEALKKVGLGEQIHKKPNQMSGGQMQRVAIARALVNNPDILLADEPTGALDSATSIQIMEILKEISKDRLIIMVTHNPELAETYASRTIRLLDGRVQSDSNPYEEPATPEPRRPSPVRKKKTSMSFLTALSLSFNNLLTKKTRTIMVSFAGSIGIIGIALILSVSNGVQAYIDRVQQDTMAGYPIELQSETPDMSAMIAELMEENSGGSDHEAGKVYVNPVIEDLMSSFSDIQTSKNNLAAFKKFLQKDKNIRKYTSAVQYGYNFSLGVYTKDSTGAIVKSDANELLRGMLLGNEGDSGFLQQASNAVELTGAVSVWQEILPGANGKGINKMVTDQYDLLYGKWPSRYNEILLIVDENNEISDITLYTLGLRTKQEMTDAAYGKNQGTSSEASSSEAGSSSDPTGSGGQTSLPLPSFGGGTSSGTESGTGSGSQPQAPSSSESQTASPAPSEGSSQPAESSNPGASSEPASSEDTSHSPTASGVVTGMSAKKSGKGSANSWTFEDICGREIKLILAGDCYQKQDNGVYIDLRDTEAGLNYLYSNEDIALPLKITGIIRPNGDAVTAMLTGSLGYTASLTDYILTETAKKPVILDQFASPEIDVLTGLAFETGDTTLTNAEKLAKFDEYRKGLSDEKKAELYRQIASIAPESYLQQITEAALAGKSLADKVGILINALAQQMGVSADTVRSYVEKMSEEELDQTVTNALREMAKAQYAAEAAVKLSVVPAAELAALLDAATFSEADGAAYYDKFVPNGASESTFEQNLQKFGYINADNPDTIYLYASSFDDKEAIADCIADYNANVPEADVINYTDYVALMMSSVSTIINAISYVLIAFVAISLVVSSIMIGIITYISVLERTKEIGILRAMGASKRDVSRVFSAETLIIGFTAGVMGVLITVLLNIPITLIMHSLTGISILSSKLPVGAGFILVGISMALTLIAGIFPSRIAAKKDPVEALRTE